MIFSIFLFLLLGCFNFVASDEDCPYESTVDLTNLHPFDNGSYVYQGILIPPEKQDFYDGYITSSEELVSFPSHLRGCVCDSEKPCINLCCDMGEFYNTSSYKCEQFSGEVEWSLKIELDNEKLRTVNVIKKFVYLIGVPCKGPEAVIWDVYDWNLLEDGNLYIDDKSINTNDYLLDTLEYCFTPHKFNNVKKYLLIPLGCPIKVGVKSWFSILHIYAPAISVLFLIPTILVYLVLKELRGNLRGKLLICQLISSLIADGITSFINIFELKDFGYTISCNLIVYSSYFFFMAAFIWLNVLCYDMWINFKAINIDDNLRENRRRFLYYSVHAWGWSTIFTLSTMWIVTSALNKHDDIEECYHIHTLIWKVGFLFYSPIVIIIILNGLAFAYIAVHVYKVRRDSANISHKERFFRENVIVLLRLFVIMGVSRIFDIIPYYLLFMQFMTKKSYFGNWLFVLSDLLTASRGLLIFTLFVLKRNVLNLLKNRFNTIKAAPNRRSGLTLTTTITPLTPTTE